MNQVRGETDYKIQMVQTHVESSYKGTVLVFYLTFY